MITNTEESKTITFSMKDFLHNPYPVYEQFRSTHPVYHGTIRKYSGWFVTGYEEALTILKDTRFKNRMPIPTTSKKYKNLRNIQDGMMLFKNQPDHWRLRSQINKVFTPRMVENLRPLIEKTAYDLLREVPSGQTMDVVSDYAFPLASLIIAQILGVPARDRQHFRQWAATLIQTIDFTRSRCNLEDGNDMVAFLSDYFSAIIQKRKTDPKQDLISFLLQEGKEKRLSDQELLATCILLVIAGHETTVNLISNSILSLINHPDQMSMLKENPSLMSSAVEEFLRYESPTQMTARVASEDIEMKGVTIREGDQVYILLGAANRDPKKFTNADILDITRTPNPHLAFGYGPHFCLGAPLSRLEAQIAIQTFLEKIPNPTLVSSKLKWRKLMGFRALNELRIRGQSP